MKQTHVLNSFTKEHHISDTDYNVQIAIVLVHDLEIFLAHGKIPTSQSERERKKKPHILYSILHCKLNQLKNNKYINNAYFDRFFCLILIELIDSFCVVSFCSLLVAL